MKLKKNGKKYGSIVVALALSLNKSYVQIYRNSDFVQRISTQQLNGEVNNIIIVYYQVHSLNEL